MLMRPGLTAQHASHDLRHSHGAVPAVSGDQTFNYRLGRSLAAGGGSDPPGQAGPGGHVAHRGACPYAAKPTLVVVTLPARSVTVIVSSRMWLFTTWNAIPLDQLVVPVTASWLPHVA